MTRFAMSKKNVVEVVNSPQQGSASSTASLTDANVATHTAVTSGGAPGALRMQRWLEDTGDRQFQDRRPSNWNRLVEEDDLAAAIESAIQQEREDMDKPSS